MLVADVFPRGAGRWPQPFGRVTLAFLTHLPPVCAPVGSAHIIFFASIFGKLSHQADPIYA